MPQITYQNFELLIMRKDEVRGIYVVNVRALGSSGDASVEFAIEDLEITTSALSIGANDTPAGFQFSRHAKLLRPLTPGAGQPISRVCPPDIDEARQLGTLLFNALFKDGVRDSLNSSLGAVRRANSSERLRLQIDLTGTPELAVLPWEYLYNPNTRHFYAQSLETPIVRYLRHDRPIRALKVKPPLRVLVVISTPTDLAGLDAEKEWGGLNEALHELVVGGLVRLDRLEKATLHVLRRKLKESQYHIFHFIGHGSFQPDPGVSPTKAGTGCLFFENEQGQSAPVNGRFLGMRLEQYDTLQLAIINACEGASSSNNDSYAGVAQNLLQYGNLAAAIAMQFAITDKSAIQFSEVFYENIAHGLPVDAALSVTRTEMIESEHDLEWATPVLFMRSSSGELFDLTDAPAAPVTPSKLNPHPLHPYYQKILAALRNGQVVIFLGLEVNLYGREESLSWRPGAMLPSNRELASHLVHELGFQFDEPLGVASVSQHAFAGQQQSDLSRILGNIFTDATLGPSLLHQFIASLLARVQADNGFLLTKDPCFRRSLIVTTTYDNLLERAFVGAGGVASPVPNFHVLSYQAEGIRSGTFQHIKYVDGKRQDSSASEDRDKPDDLVLDTLPVIIKLPGGIEGMELRYAIAEDHFFSFAGGPLPNLRPKQLMSKLQNSCHLYLGYKIRDWTLRAILYAIWGMGRSRMESWAVLPDAHKADKSYWETCDVRVIEASLDSFIKGLRDRIEVV